MQVPHPFALRKGGRHELQFQTSFPKGTGPISYPCKERETGAPSVVVVSKNERRATRRSCHAAPLVLIFNEWDACYDQSPERRHCGASP